MRIGLTGIFLLVLVACSSRKVPEGILAPEKMEAVMWDMIQAGEFLNGYVLFRDTLTHQVLESQRWYSKIYALHETDQQEFIRSYQYYRDHPKLMQAVFDSMALYEEKLPVSDTTTSPAAGDSTGGKALTDSFGQRRLRKPGFPGGNVELKPE